MTLPFLSKRTGVNADWKMCSSRPAMVFSILHRKPYPEKADIALDLWYLLRKGASQQNHAKEKGAKSVPGLLIFIIFLA
jgi:hypothetical protein